MTFEELKKLKEILLKKASEGIAKLEETPIESTTYHTVLSNIVLSMQVNQTILPDTYVPEEQGE
jgi:hypothetical protein